MPSMTPPSGALVYPYNLLGEDIPHLIFRPSKYQTIFARGSAGVGSSKPPSSDEEIKIAVPNSLISNDQLSYDTISGLKASAMANLASGTIAGGIVDGIAALMPGIVTSVVNEAAGAAFGAKINPKEELLFNTPSLRTHSFTFNMFAKNAKDAANIVAIINRFKSHAYPDVVGVGDLIDKAKDTAGVDFGEVGNSIQNAFTGRNDSVYMFPDQFEISLEPDDDNGFAFIPAAVCTSISTNYSGNGLTVIQQDGKFQSIELTLTFQDISTSNKNTIFGRPYNDDNFMGPVQ